MSSTSIGQDHNAAEDTEKPRSPHRAGTWRRARCADGPNMDLLLVNARVLTMDRRKPSATAVVIRGDTIAAVGDRSTAEASAGNHARTIDCQGLTLIPGLIDSHCHILAQVAAIQGLDCGPDSVSSIAELAQAVHQRAAQTPIGHWIRGYGYDDTALAESRHPSREDLDTVAPHHAVRLNHRSGHASALNSLGLQLAGIHADTPDPPEGVIDRNPVTGQPTGLLLDMAGYLRDQLGRTSSDNEVEEGVKRLSTHLLGYGVTSVQDAGPSNGLSQWSTFSRLRDTGAIGFRTTMMAGFPQLQDLLSQDLQWGTGDDRTRVGHVKIMLTLTTGQLYPPPETLREMVEESHHLGFPVAVHAVEQEAVAAVAQVLSQVGLVSGSRGTPPDRIEHCSECPAALIELVRESGAMVVTQPAFIYWNGDRYLEQVEPDLLPHLYPIASLRRASIPVAFGSDAPVVRPNPWPGIYSAVTRGTREGRHIPEWSDAGTTGHDAVVLDVLRMHTSAGATSEGSSRRKGSISPGKLADLVLLDADPTSVEYHRLKDIRSVLTILGGSIAWNEGLKEI